MDKKTALAGLLAGLIAAGALLVPMVSHAKGGGAEPAGAPKKVGEAGLPAGGGGHTGVPGK